MSAACLYEADTGLVLERHTDAEVAARHAAGIESWHVFRVFGQSLPGAEIVGSLSDIGSVGDVIDRVTGKVRRLSLPTEALLEIAEARVQRVIDSGAAPLEVRALVVRIIRHVGRWFLRRLRERLDLSDDPDFDDPTAAAEFTAKRAELVAIYNQARTAASGAELQAAWNAFKGALG